jgi:N-acetylmuramoyl-L-alanine amidase
MPTYKVTDPTSGQVLQLTGDSPPSEDEITQAFADHKTQSTPQAPPGLLSLPLATSTPAQPPLTAPRATSAASAAPSPTPQANSRSFTPDDIAYLAKTAYGEAEGEGPTGEDAVMHVIANRLNAKPAGTTVQAVVQAPHQFESWAQGNPRQAVMQGIDLNDPKYAKLVSLAKAVLGGQDADPTGGSTLFYNAKKASPSWASKAVPTAVIGQHTFMKELK